MSQKSAGFASLFKLFSAIGLVLFLIISLVVDFKNGPFALLFPKSSAYAAAGDQIYWGARIDSDVYGVGYEDAPWGANTWDLFESHTGQKVSILHWGQPWNQSFNTQINQYNYVLSRGAIPLVSMDSGSIKLSDIASGAHDTFLITWAQQAKAWGHPFFLRFDWEMNGGWFPWGTTGSNVNTPADYVAAWKRFHDIAVAQGATNVTWVWCVNTEFSGSTNLESLYPGDSYVDWTSIDGYNFGTNPLKPGGWKSFSQVFKSTYDHLLILAPSKPIMIAETGSSEIGGSKASWLTDTLTTQLPTNFPKIKAFVWFNWNILENGGRWDWPIESSLSSRSAFANGLASNYYAANNFSNLPLLSKVQALAPSPTPSVILGDINNDGRVNILDLSLLFGDFNKSGTNIPGDLNRDGRVNILDFNLLLGNFGKTS